MDPGNWATDLAGGARYEYALLSVIGLSNLMAILLQTLAARLGIASGRDLAQACRDRYSRPTAIALWIVCEIAIAACDLAEVIGAAIALNLLFGLPLLAGVILTAADVLIVLYLQHHGFRYVEALVVALILTIAGAFAFELWLARPELGGGRRRLHPARVDRPEQRHALHRGRHPRRDRDAAQPLPALLDRPDAQVRRLGRQQARGDPLRDDRLVGCADVRALHQRRDSRDGRGDVPRRGPRRRRRYRGRVQLLSPLLGSGVASIVFAIALLLSGQNATLTGTLAGQIVMEGFMNIRLRPWLRRLITRLVAIVPAIIVVIALRRARHGRTADSEPGGAEPAAAVRGDPARPLHERSAPDGPVREPGVAAVDRVGRRGYHRGAERRGCSSRRSPEAAMYRHILVAVENSPADRTILDHVVAPRGADRREAAARPRRRRLGRAQLRAAQSARVRGDAEGPRVSGHTQPRTGRPRPPGRCRARDGRSGHRARAGSGRSPGRFDRDVHARPSLSWPTCSTARPRTESGTW